MRITQHPYIRFQQVTRTGRRHLTLSAVTENVWDLPAVSYEIRAHSPALPALPWQIDHCK